MASTNPKTFTDTATYTIFDVSDGDGVELIAATITATGVALTVTPYFRFASSTPVAGNAIKIAADQQHLLLAPGKGRTIAKVTVAAASGTGSATFGATKEA